MSGSSSANVTTDGSIMIGGTGTGSSSSVMTSHDGDIVINNSEGSSSSARITAENGSVYVGGNFSGTSSTNISAPNGAVYVTGTVTLTSSGRIDAAGSVLVGGNVTMSSSSQITAPGTFATGGNLSLSSSSRITAGLAQYVGSYSCISSCVVTPPPNQVGTVSVPSVPMVEDPYASVLEDADMAKVQQYYPAYPSGLTTVTRTVAASSTGSIAPTSLQKVRATVSSSATGTLNPGIYEWLRCQSSAKCILNAGTYYFDGGAAALSLSSSAKLTANGPVTLVFLNSSGMTANSSSQMTITAPDPSTAPSSTYPWPGVAIYFARGNTSTLELSSSSGNAVTGIIYAPDGTLKMTSSTAQTVVSTVVVGTYNASSSSTLSVVAYDDGLSSEPGPLQLVK